MKIVYIHDTISKVGGVERIFAEKMNYLAEVLDYEIYLITSSQGNHPFIYNLSSKIRHIDLDVNFHLQYKCKYPFRLWEKWKMNKIFCFRLNCVLQDIKPNIIIGTTWKGDVICRLKCDAKKMIESHTARSYTGIDDSINRNLFVRFFSRKYISHKHSMIEKESDVVVSLTKGDAVEWRKAKKVEVIPNVTNVVRPNIPLEKANLKRIISAGRLEYQKGYDLLIDAWKFVKTKHSDWILNIYGDGSLKENIKEQISKLDIADCVILHDAHTTIYDEYLNNEFFVMSSRYEGWGLVLVEAMACGIPCIAFDCPYGPSDIIEHGRNGLLVKNGDIEALADAICWMIEHEEERKQMGIAARETSKKFRPEVIMKQWDELFKELVKQ